MSELNSELMSEEEKKAIEIFTSWYNYNKKNRNKLLEADKIIKVQKTILNLIEKLEKELNSLKEIEQQHQEENGKLRVELEQEKEKNKELEEVIARLEEDVEGYSGLAKQIQKDYSKQ